MKIINHIILLLIGLVKNKMLTPEQIEFQRNYYFENEDNYFRQKYDPNWCKFYGGPLHNEWQHIDNTSRNLHTMYPRNNFTFIREMTFENMKEDWYKVAVYKPVIRNFTIMPKSPMRNVVDVIVDYVYCGCQY